MTTSAYSRRNDDKLEKGTSGLRTDNDSVCGNFLALSTSGVMKIGFVLGYFPKKKKANIYWTGLRQVFVLIEFGAILIEEIVDRKQRKSMEIHLTKEQAPINTYINHL